MDGSWPFNTEMGARLIGQGTAALASSIFLVCRKRKADAGIGITDDVRRDIETNVRERLDDFWRAGLRGADFFISAIGPATAAFSRYDKVMTMGGDDVSVSTLLQWVQETVADYALQRVFTVAAEEQGGDTTEGGLGAVDDETRFYVLWRWTYDGQASAVGAADGANGNGAKSAALPAPDDGAAEAGDAENEGAGGKGREADTKKIPFGDALLMATALGADANALIHRHHLLDGSSAVKLLGARERAALVADLGERRADGSRPPLIDILHRAQLLWASGRQDQLTEYLDEALPGEREPLRRVAQALVDLLPRGDGEKQRLEGLLYSGAASDTGAGGAPRPQAPTQPSLGEAFGVGDAAPGRRPRRRGR